MELVEARELDLRRARAALRVACCGIGDVSIDTGDAIGLAEQQRNLVQLALERRDTQKRARKPATRIHLLLRIAVFRSQLPGYEFCDGRNLASRCLKPQSYFIEDLASFLEFGVLRELRKSSTPLGAQILRRALTLQAFACPAPKYLACHELGPRCSTHPTLQVVCKVVASLDAAPQYAAHHGWAEHRHGQGGQKQQRQEHLHSCHPCSTVHAAESSTKDKRPVVAGRRAWDDRVCPLPGFDSAWNHHDRPS